MISQPTALPFREGTEGIWLDLLAETYHAAEGCSHTMLKHIDPPARLPVYLSGEREITAAMILGTLTHHRVLEPLAPLPKVIVPPRTYPAPVDCSAVKQKKAQPGDPLDWHWSAKFCKAWAAQMEEQGQIILTETEFNTVEGMVRSIKDHPLCKSIFADGWSEVSVFKNSITSPTVLRKARLDWVPRHGSALVDVKTCQDASLDAFAKTILDQGYHCQAAYYLDLWNDAVWETAFTPREHFVFIAVEKTPPYLVAVYNLHIEAVKKGRGLNMDRLVTYGRCSAKKEWPGFSPDVETINLPQWAYKTNATEWLKAI